MSDEMTEEAFGSQAEQPSEPARGERNDHGLDDFNLAAVPTEHPDPETIVLYALNLAKGRTREKVSLHIGICPYCRVEVEALIEAMDMPLESDGEMPSGEVVTGP